MQKRMIIPALAVIVGLVLAIGNTAFTKKANTKPATITYFKFVGNSVNDYFVASGWQSSTSQFDDCPASVHSCTVSSDTYSTPSDLASFLNNGGSHLNQDVNHGNAYLIESKRAEFPPGLN